MNGANKGKITAAFVAFAMLAVAFTFVYADDTSADDMEFSMFDAQPSAATNYGEFNIYVKFGSGSWSSNYGVDGYNAAIAIDSLNLGIPMDMNYTTYQGFYNINPEYGKISLPFTHNGVTYTYMNIGYYNVDQSGWRHAPTQSLGFLKPFADYELRTANIAISFSTSPPISESVVPPYPANAAIQGLVSLATIQGNPDFAVDFGFVINLTAPQRAHYISIFGNEPSIEQYTAIGYGSDGYLALKNVLGSAVVGQGNVLRATANGNVINQSYGSVQDIDDAQYWENEYFTQFFYWSLYTVDGLSAPVYASFVLGFYSPLSEASALNENNFDFVVDTFNLEFTFSAF